MLRTKDAICLWIPRSILLFSIAGVAIISVLACPSGAEEGIFMNIKTKTRYKMVLIHFEIKEGATDDDSEIEVLRADTMKSNYQVIGSLKYSAGQRSYLFEDKKIKKARYFYKLQVKGKDITSKSFRGKASFVPPGT